MRRNSILGALALCMVLLCAFGATNVSAAQLTAVTCETVTAGTGNYKTSACETPKQAGSNFETKALPVGQTTEVTGEGVGLATLKLTVAFTQLLVTCEETIVTSHVTNREPKAGEHIVEGSKLLIDYKKCHAALQTNLTKKCEVESITGTAGVKGTIATTELKSTTTTEHNIKFEPVAGNFAEFKILSGECMMSSLVIKLTGSLLGVADTNKHNHVTFTPATNGGSFKSNFGAASYEATSRVVMKGTTNSVGAETFT